MFVGMRGRYTAHVLLRPLDVPLRLADGMTGGLLYLRGSARVAQASPPHLPGNSVVPILLLTLFSAFFRDSFVMCSMRILENVLKLTLKPEDSVFAVLSH